MKLKPTEDLESIVLPIAAAMRAGKQGIPLSDSDMQKFQGVYALHKSLQGVFGDRLGSPVLVGGEIRMALMPDPSLANYTAGQFSAQLELTADQLKTNAASTDLLPHSKALTHVAFGKLLETISSVHRKSGTSLVVCFGGERYDAPVLEPTAFVEPNRPDELRMTSTFEITGIYRCWKGGPLGLYVGENRLLIELPADNANWHWGKIHDVLEQPTYLLGTLVRETKSSPWRPEAGARLERQEVMKQVMKIADA